MDYSILSLFPTWRLLLELHIQCQCPFQNSIPWYCFKRLGASCCCCWCHSSAVPPVCAQGIPPPRQEEPQAVQRWQSHWALLRIGALWKTWQEALWGPCYLTLIPTGFPKSPYPTGWPHSTQPSLIPQLPLLFPSHYHLSLFMPLWASLKLSVCFFFLSVWPPLDVSINEFALFIYLGICTGPTLQHLHAEQGASL